MAIELSTITFTNRADILPASGVEEILINTGIANTLAGNDEITGTGRPSVFSIGIFNQGVEGSSLTSPVSINTGDGNDRIVGTGSIFGIFNWEDINTGNGNDRITGTSSAATGISNYYDDSRYYNFYDLPRIDTGDGNDEIIGTGPGAISNQGLISTGNGNDSIIAYGKFSNTGTVNLGNGNDSIIVNGDIYNAGTINTGKGNDSITAYGTFNRESFTGPLSLEDGNDYFYGFGNGSFLAGNGKDTLELPPGSYTIELSLFTVNFTEDNTFTDTFPPQKLIMNTSGFEKLITGDTTYDFSSLTHGQRIFVT